MNRLVMSLAALACLTAAGATPDYFPLAAGNQWVYRTGGTRAADPLVLEITQAEDFDGTTWYLLHGMRNGDYWLRMDDEGKLYSLDPQTKEQKLWYDFQAPEGKVFDTAIPYCCGKAVIASRAAHYSGPLGDFDSALEVNYPGVFQLGITSDFFLPYVGLVSRAENTGGPSVATYDLIYARLGGLTVLNGPELSFGLTLDQAVYGSEPPPPGSPPGVPVLTARITLRCTSTPVSLTFPTGQTYDLVIRDASGRKVYQWSSGKAFPMLFHTETYSGEKNWAVAVPLADADGNPFPDGAYSAEARLTTQGPRTFRAAAVFDIRHPQ